MRKQIVSFLIITMPAASLWASNTFISKAKGYNIKGPVKTYKSTKNKSIELTFNEKGDLIEGKLFRAVNKLQCLYTTTLDSHGNITQIKEQDYRIKCPDCEKTIRETEEEFAKAEAGGYVLNAPVQEGGDSYRKCKQKPDYVKQQIASIKYLTYDDHNRLVKSVTSEASEDYIEHIHEFKYDEAGHKIEETSYRSSHPENKYIDTWVYKDGLLVSDHTFNYIYNEKGQLTEQIDKKDENLKTIYTYHDNGNIKQVITIGYEDTDTLICNTKGDTLKCVKNLFYALDWPDDIVEYEIQRHSGYYRFVDFEYDKNNVITNKKFYNKKRELICEETYDKKGLCVKKVFNNGYVEYSYKKKQISEKLYLNNHLKSVITYNGDKSITETNYDEKGEVKSSLIREFDEYGNITKEVTCDKYTTRTTNYEYTYYK